MSRGRGYHNAELADLLWEKSGSLQDLAINALLHNITRCNPQAVGRLPLDIVTKIGSKLSPLMLLIYEDELHKRGVKTNTLWYHALLKTTSINYFAPEVYEGDSGVISISNARQIYLHSHFHDLFEKAVLHHGIFAKVQSYLAHGCLDTNELYLCKKLTLSHFVPYLTILTIKASQIRWLSGLALNQLAPFLKTIKVRHITNESFSHTIRFFAFLVRYGKQPEVHLIDYHLKPNYCKMLMEVLSGYKTVSCPSFNQQYIDAIPSIKDITTHYEVSNGSVSFLENYKCNGGLKCQFGAACKCNDEQHDMPAHDDHEEDHFYFEDHVETNAEASSKNCLTNSEGSNVKEVDSLYMDSLGLSLVNENAGEDLKKESVCEQTIDHVRCPGITSVVIMYPMGNAEDCMMKALCNELESWPDLEQLHLQLGNEHSARLVTRSLLQVRKPMKKVVLESVENNPCDVIEFLVHSLLFDLIGQSLMDKQDKPLFLGFICPTGEPIYLNGEQASENFPAAPFTLTFKNLVQPKPFAGVVELCLHNVSYDDKVIAYFIENDVSLKRLSLIFLPEIANIRSSHILTNINLGQVIADKKTLTSIKLSSCTDLAALTPALFLDILRQNCGLTHFHASYYVSQSTTDITFFMEDFLSVIGQHPALLSFAVGRCNWKVNWLNILIYLNSGHTTSKLEHFSVKQLSLNEDDFTALEQQLQPMLVAPVLNTLEVYGIIVNSYQCYDKKDFKKAFPSISQCAKNINVFVPRGSHEDWL